MLTEAAYADMQSGFVQYFQAQIAAKKNVRQSVTNLALLGRTDLAANYSRYLSRAKLPMGKAIEASLAMQKAGKRPRNKIARFMKDQQDIKWTDSGFYLLYDDWSDPDLVDFFDSDRHNDYRKVARDVFGGDLRDSMDAWSYVNVEDMVAHIDERNYFIIKQLLIGRTLYNSDGEQAVLTKEMAQELTDDEINDLLIDRGNKEGPTEDICQAVKGAGVFAEESSMESGYFDTYKKALESALGEGEWIDQPTPDGKKSRLGFFVTYARLEEWINAWKEENGDDDFHGSIHDLALEFTEKLQPAEPSSSGVDTDYFNQVLRENLGEIKMEAPIQDPNQPELPLENEPQSQPLEPDDTTTVRVGDGNRAEDNVYKNIPASDAQKYVQKVPKARMTTESLVTALLERAEVKSEFHQPENFDSVQEQSDWQMYAGANDWEVGHSAACVLFPDGTGTKSRIWITIKHPDGNDTSSVKQADTDGPIARGKKAVSTWIKIAKKLHGSKDYYAWYNCFEDALNDDEMKEFIDKHGADKTQWCKTVVEETEIISENDARGFVIASRSDRGMVFISKNGWVRDEQRAAVFPSRSAADAHFKKLGLDTDHGADIIPFRGGVREAIDPKEFASQMEPTGWIIKHIPSRGVKSPQTWCSGRSHGTGEDIGWSWEWTPRQNSAMVYHRVSAEAELSKMQEALPEENFELEPVHDDLTESCVARTPERLDEAIYRLSTTQIDLPDDIGQHVISWGKLNIPDDALYVEEDGGCGRETEQHISVLYGLTDAEPSEALAELIGTTKPFLIELGGVSIFENEKYDVVKLDVISEELTNLSNEIRRVCPNENKFPDYHGHVTIAYVKPGRGKEFVGQDVFKAAQVPRDFWAYDVLFKGAGDSEDGNRVVEVLHFDKTGDPGHDEPEPGEQRYPEATRVDLDTLIDQVGDMQREMRGESEVDPKDMADRASRPVEKGCPGCGGHKLSDPDDEGLVDCFDCGIWFDPAHPRNLGENEMTDPKEFLYRQHYKVRYGIGARTKYLKLREGPGDIDRWVEDPFGATAFSHQEAVAQADRLRGSTGPDSTVRIEMCESERVDPKSFVQQKVSPPHEMSWVGRDLVCTCGWRCKNVGDWSSSIPNALKEFKRHVRAQRKQERSGMSESEIDHKQYADDTPYKCVIRKNRPRGRQEDLEDRNFFWNAEAGAWTKNIYAASTFPNRASAERALEIMLEKFPNAKVTFDGAAVEPVSMYESMPFEDDGLPGEVSSFLKKVRSKRKKVTAKPVL
jgi:hypothetical protein